MKKIKITRPSAKEAEKLGIDKWEKWSSPPTAFDWEYPEEETAYVFEGRVKVKTEWEEVEIKAGDLVVFPKGLKCRWEVHQTIRKVYRFS